MPAKTNYKEHDCECSDVCNFISSFQLYFLMSVISRWTCAFACLPISWMLALNNKIKYIFLKKDFF